MAIVEQRDTDGIINEDDESNGSSVTPLSNRPSHARKARVEGNGGSNEHKKRGRGTVEGLAVSNKRFKERIHKLPIEFSKTRGGPIGPNRRAFVDEVILFTRKWAPLTGVNSWKDIDDDVKGKIAEQIRLTWNFTNIETEDERNDKIWRIASDRYKGWRVALSATYRAYNSYAERIRNKPEELDIVEWHYLHLYFGSETFMKVSSQNSTNRQQQKTMHLMGSKSFSQCGLELTNEETGEEPSDLLLWRSTHTKEGKWSNSVSAAVYENAAMKIGQIGLEPDRQALSATEENMIFQSCYKETTQIKLSKLHGRGYLTRYQTRRDLMKENLEVHARIEAAAKERSITFEAEVEKLKQQRAQEAIEREREREEDRSKMQEDLENHKKKLREEMMQELHNMLVQQKETTMDMTTPHNNDSLQIAPTVQEDDENGEAENENELQQPGSVVAVQSDARTLSSNNTTIVSKNLFNENTANMAANKMYTTTQQLINKARSSKRRKLVENASIGGL